MGTAETRQAYSLDLLKNSELFSTLLEDDLRYIAERTSMLELEKGSMLFSAGEKALRFYIVIKGAICIFRKNEQGSSDEMAVFGDADAIGEFDFARKAAYDAGAIARTDSVLLSFPGIGLSMDILARERPDTVSRILLRSLAMIASRVRSTQVLISENKRWVQELRRRSYEDPGTGLWNQAFLKEEIPRHLKTPTLCLLFKPDRFKILVDGHGHAAGDEAMLRIAGVLKGVIRRYRHGWALRLKSNECALVIPGCDETESKKIAAALSATIYVMKPVPAIGDGFPFPFSASIVYGLWPQDSDDWNVLFESMYSKLLELSREGGNRVYRQRPCHKGERM